MTILQTPEVFRNAWKTVIASGLMALALGVVILIWPGKSILVAAVLFGAYLLISGIGQIAFALALDVTVGSRVLMLISGALSVVLGVLAFRHFGGGFAVMLLAIWIGVSFIFQGVSEAVLAISHSELPGRGWHTFLGILTAIAGMIVLTWPFDSIVMLATVTGAWLVVIGICQIIWAFQARRTVEHTAQGIQRLAGAAR
ncbi:HdeD family acid-resistance protein [Mycobacterium sp. 050128]|uniref:HdeD family acid-resistance protein n=1 Tax=Mycobacterium sp. 050128 TaxID=3096112 RepID=UPI002EDA501F